MAGKSVKAQKNLHPSSDRHVCRPKPDTCQHLKRSGNIMKNFFIFASLTVFLYVGCFAGFAQAGDQGTKDEAVAMVKKAIEFIKANGNEKAFEEISNPKGKFVDRDLYVVVYDMNAKCLAHGQKASMVGKELIDFKDTDGKEFYKERVELMKKQATAWQDYKFMNPVSKEIEPKSMYLERTGDLIVGCGVYSK
jgi:cytochrome c